jgi:plasmid stabilization system protein ParE
MISPVTQRPRARLDLLEQFVYFGEQAGVDLAERYFAAVEATCLQLVDQPQLGVFYDSCEKIGTDKALAAKLPAFSGKPRLHNRLVVRHNCRVCRSTWLDPLLGVQTSTEEKALSISYGRS